MALKKKIETEEEEVLSSNLSFSNLVVVISVCLSAKFTYDKIILSQELAMEMGNLNNTIFADKEVLFFNRVPKVGSQTMMGLLDILQHSNNFTHYVDSEDIKKKSGERTLLDLETQIVYADMFMANFTPPSSYTKHISYIDFKALGNQYYQPIYMNFVREPVQRIISWYYYIRAPWYQFNFDKKNGSRYSGFKGHFGLRAKPLKISFEECLDNGDPECTHIEGHDHIIHGEGGSHASQIMFFCGHHPHCRIINGEKAFLDARSNIEKYFAVVGVLEEFEKSLIVLENYIPRFFAGVSEIYTQKLHIDRKHVNENKFKPPVGEWYRSMVRRNLSREVELYEFCRQRLHNQYLALNL